MSKRKETVNLKCVDCGTPLPWSGKGRKPTRCKPCRAKANRERRRQDLKRDRTHKKGKSVSRWGQYWLLTYPDGSPKAVRRESRFVMGIPSPRDGVIMTDSGAFRRAGAHGIPGQGRTTSNEKLASEIRNKYWVRKGSTEHKWLQKNPDWWRFEEFAHQSLSINVKDLIHLHGWMVEPPADESAQNDRCSFCCERADLVLAGEFCSSECFTDYVMTFGPDGLNLGVYTYEYMENAGRLDASRREVGEALVP